MGLFYSVVGRQNQPACSGVGFPVYSESHSPITNPVFLDSGIQTAFDMGAGNVRAKLWLFALPFFFVNFIYPPPPLFNAFLIFGGWDARRGRDLNREEHSEFLKLIREVTLP